MKLMIRTSKEINNKRGSYIVEATLILPIFMIAIMVMSSIISAYSCIEDANYISANHLRKSAAPSFGNIFSSIAFLTLTSLSYLR